MRSRKQVKTGELFPTAVPVRPGVEAGPKARPGRMRVLLVGSRDPEARLGGLWAMLGREPGAEVRLVAGLEAAYAQLETWGPQALILDLPQEGLVDEAVVALKRVARDAKLVPVIDEIRDSDYRRLTKLGLDVALRWPMHYPQVQGLWSYLQTGKPPVEPRPARRGSFGGEPAAARGVPTLPLLSPLDPDIY
jgi:hypothetical protein